MYSGYRMFVSNVSRGKYADQEKDGEVIEMAPFTQSVSPHNKQTVRSVSSVSNAGNVSSRGKERNK
ncbi:hypothetical protein E2C01_096962 [Portunus trituberculatus]|uniref:Uncharacterized protein n=1 Tax=Portunus trituberculatus TaxID=210409 RepID=A0A5B7K9V6_PORTR|nr:hypothetical protein [Portunus trituberculatus]